MLKSEPGRQVCENSGVGEDSWAMDFPKKVLCIKNSLPHLAREEKWMYCFSCQTNAKEIHNFRAREEQCFYHIYPEPDTTVYSWKGNSGDMEGLW